LVFLQETPEYGGQLPADRLRRPKTQIHYVWSCPEDLQAILETITLAAGDNENYEKTKFFGTGEEAMSDLNDFISKRKRKRARNILFKIPPRHSSWYLNEGRPSNIN
jgi:hypothetical protein